MNCRCLLSLQALALSTSPHPRERQHGNCAGAPGGNLCRQRAGTGCGRVTGAASSTCRPAATPAYVPFLPTSHLNQHKCKGCTDSACTHGTLHSPVTCTRCLATSSAVCRMRHAPHQEPGRAAMAKTLLLVRMCKLGHAAMKVA